MHSYVPLPLHAACTLCNRPPPPTFRPVQPAPHRVHCLRPSAEDGGLQPATELEHLERHGDDRHVFCALLPSRPAHTDICAVARLPCKLFARRLTYRSAARPAPPYPACDPRQGAIAFNQPLSWDTSRVTDMHAMFNVCCSPRPAPKTCSLPPSPLLSRCVHTTSHRAASRPAARRAPHRVPRLRPSAARVRLQPAPELGHLARHDHVQDVYRALLPALCPRYLQSQPSSRHPACTPRSLEASGPPPRSSPRTVCLALATPGQAARVFNQQLS